MSEKPFTRERFWAELERLGEEEVSLRIATGKYRDVHQKKSLAEEWLRLKDHERSESRHRASLASNAESLRIARSAKNAAWIAAIAATIAAIATGVTIYLI
jgi:hypothetical protein